MAFAGQLSIRELPAPKPDLVVISPNDPGAMVRYVQECQELGIAYFYDPSQQIVRLDANALRAGIEGAHALLVNDYEFSLIQKATGLSQEEIQKRVKFLVVTCGKHGADIYTPEECIHVPVCPEDRKADPTGVGDAFRGGFLVGFAHGWDLKLCGQMGSLAATYCLENTGPQGHRYTPAEFVRRFRQHFDDSGKLDVLVKE
jgi:adenosine kinase